MIAYIPKRTLLKFCIFYPSVFVLLFVVSFSYDKYIKSK